MGFRKDAYAKCWSIEPGKGNFTKVRMSISRKNKETGNYESEFSGFVMMIGNAHAKAQKLNPGDNIKLGDVDVTNTYDKERQREYVNYKCFSFDMANNGDGGGSAPRPNQPVESTPYEGDVDEDPPF